MLARNACKAIAKGPEIMVITDDHTFFKIFASSPTAEGILLSQVQEVLRNNEAQRQQGFVPPIHIKLEGELVWLTNPK